MKYSCEMIRDLLPLYLDDVASPSSRQVVEEHLQECPDCQRMLGRLKNDETELAISAEKEDVIAGQRRFFKRNSAVVGSVIAGIFMVPILVCLIVNLASGAGLGWFFIVLASLLVAASLSIVPLMAPENKGLWTLGSFAASLILLFAVCCLYTRGTWFFVASSAVLFGLCLVFLPFVVRSRLLSDYLGDRRGLAVMTADTVLFLVMMLTIGLHTRAPGFFRIASAISVPILLLAWGLFCLLWTRQKNRPKQDPPARPEPRSVSKPFEPRRRLQAWEIVLLALGSPLWLALLITAFAILLTVFAVIWALIISLWAVAASFAAGCIGGIGLGLWSIFQGSGLQGLVLLCAAAVLAGLAILLFFGCRAATKGASDLTTKITFRIKSLFLNRRNAS